MINFSVNIVFRPSTKKSGKHEGSLFLRIIHNNQTKTLTIPNCHLFPEEWDDKQHAVIFPANDAQRRRQVRIVADKIAKEKENLENKIKQNKENFNVEDFLNYYRNYRHERNSLLTYCENLALYLERNSRERTARAYRSTARRIVAFNRGVDIPLNELTADLVKKFETRLKKEGISPNSISFYMRNLRAIYYKAIAEKYIEAQDENPFADVRKAMQTTIKQTLLASDIQKIFDFDFSLCKVEQVKQLYIAQRFFLFSFYARGMSFVDIAYLRKQNILNNAIRYYRRKTGKMIKVIITSEIQNIIDSFADDVRNSLYVFPIIKTEFSKKARMQYEAALRKQNRYLQQMAEMAGVKKKITMDMARHSWANIGKEKNLPISVISECLGHASDKITEIYLASLNSTILDDANNLVISAIKSS